VPLENTQATNHRVGQIDMTTKHCYNLQHNENDTPHSTHSSWQASKFGLVKAADKETIKAVNEDEQCGNVGNQNIVISALWTLTTPVAWDATCE
jgi:hypothetical protein